MIKCNTAVICLSHHSGGMEIDAIKLAKKLKNDVRITLIAKENSFISDTASTDKECKDIDIKTIKFRSKISFSIIFRARKIIKSNNIKNVIFFGASELKSLYFAFLGLDINLIVRHGTTKSSSKKDLFHKLIYQKVNYHVCISKHLEKNVKNIIPFGKKTKTKIIYPSFPHTNYSIKRKEENKIVNLLHVGRVVEGKGQTDAMKACSALEEHSIDFTFDIVGHIEEDYKIKFMQIYNSLPYKHKINLVGFKENVDSYLEKSDIFLFPSYGEGFGNAFLEALSYGLHCISYSNTSFYEFKAIGFKFKLAKNKDINDLKKHLLEAVNETDNATLSLIENKNIVKSQFSLKNELDNYLSILR